MKTVSITLEYDPEEESIEAYNKECYMLVNAAEMHDNLLGIYTLLEKYDKGKKSKLSTKERALLNDIRSKAAKYLIGLKK